MTLNELTQVFDTVNFGLVVLDRDIKIQYWNRWMAMHSGLPSEQIIGEPLFDFFPHLNTPGFNKNCKAVLSFGNFAFFSQKLHRFLFPFKPDSSFGYRFDLMQQSCTMGPLRSDDNSISGLFLIVQDVTELATYEQKLVEMNTKDVLTGIYNRRFLESRLQEEFERHRRHSHPLSLIMIDIDFFKKVNDNYGHQCGDAVLQAVAGKTSSVIRKTDFVARYGGEEFCCLLPETSVTAAEIVAENIRTHIEQIENIFEGNTIKVTISLGISGLMDKDSPETLLKRADDALYQAKHSGRNRFVRF
ncbi:MAG: GGDEF domain-containing protein [Geobacteraceae bacterium]|nr:GGDEF domain-containing protein [Geobacteraceae bacterium]NTW81392.1 GGDEF domain-containing protein [Geobacteraceae bacterium]